MTSLLDARTARPSTTHRTSTRTVVAATTTLIDGSPHVVARADTTSPAARRPVSLMAERPTMDADRAP